MADYVLEVVEGPDAGSRIAIVGETVLGRVPSAGVALQDELLVRRHERLAPLARKDLRPHDPGRADDGTAAAGRWHRLHRVSD